ncbi:DUF350 domain-containing protein [Corynebacterium uberis]|uniref:DUF350 domain-containing protein n=1 Tax=Corynebacterium TaxID=1716 RepID=UPI001D0B25E3|nr:MULTISPECIES: DUF350 domain-containing protein [Corynebacterium]MCZ9309746.1 DUF350 domain-containing protein [Corynebacterium sp. c6VSa_13]UDL73549.1 DUF350 domain-containing protein [Corynebacterium uberis]UDL75571.1 DUF350 domain-containing protein [Corynebacterium uberis]UDL77784.1 DUF350 domain-containing protein [Corynebacterium uberis]UDL80067.1 DUF350 domain-containing protein [Corynebacterium uberis]
MDTQFVQDLVSGVGGTVAYFAVAAVVLVVGFCVLDALTPGNLHQLVFIHHLPNAAVLAAAGQISLGIIVVSAIVHSPEAVAAGLVYTAVYAVVGLVIQAVALVVIEVLIPGRVRDVVRDPQLRAGVVVAGVCLVVVACVNAACMS